MLLALYALCLQLHIHSKLYSLHNHKMSLAEEHACFQLHKTSEVNGSDVVHTFMRVCFTVLALLGVPLAQALLIHTQGLLHLAEWLHHKQMS